jgi:hypothetical protein
MTQNDLDFTNDDARYRFTVKEENDGTPFIALEPLDGNLHILENAILTLRFTHGTAMRTAETLVKELNANIG